jgi:CRISPR-associated protein Csh1
VLVALKEYGDQVRKRQDKTGLDFYLTLDRLKNTEKILVIDFTWNSVDADYRGVHVESAGNKERTLYSGSGKGRGGDYSPTSIISSPKKTLKRIWEEGWFGKYEGDNDLVKELIKVYMENKEDINQDVLNKYGEIDTDERSGCILTIKIHEESNENYINSYPVFKESVKQNVQDSWINKYNTTSKGEGSCSICHNDGEVVGFAYPFSFHTFDNIGFASSLNVENAWKMLPICKDCAYSLKAGQSKLDENSFRTNLGNIRYYILPEFPFGNPPARLVDRLLKGKSENQKGFISQEEFYTEVLQDMTESPMNMNFLFYTVNNSQQRIEKYIEDVSPSWIKKLQITLAQKVKIKSVFHEESIKKVLGKKWTGNWDPDTLDSLIFRVLPDSREIHDFTDKALYFLGNILSRKGINLSHLFHLYRSELRRRFNKQESEIGFYERPEVYSLNSFMFYLFLLELDLLKSDEIMFKHEFEINTRQQKFEDFFEEYSKAFDKPEKRAVFLEGVLVQHLMDVQWARRSATPFRSKLSGLNLDENRMKRILCDVDEKLYAYEVGYPSLRTLTSSYMVQSDQNGWTLSREELAYFFTLGMNLSRIFKKGEEEDE